MYTLIDSILPQKAYSTRASVHALPTLPDLLDRAGFTIRSATRADCRSCTGSSTGTVAFRGDVYYCHRCRRGGNRASLARELGLIGSNPESMARQHAEAQATAKLRQVADRLRDI